MSDLVTSENGGVETDNHARVRGDRDATLIASEFVTSFDDIVGFKTAGRVVDQQYDLCTDDIYLQRALHPSFELEHTIHRILSRPTLIKTGNVDTSDPPGYCYEFDIMSTIRTNPAYKNLRDKLMGFYGIHATIHCKITFNSQPFQQGLYNLFYVPFWDGFNSTDTYFRNGPEWLPFGTGCPNTICNLAEQSELELVIPYTGPNAFVNLTNWNADWGIFYLQTMAPIKDNTNQTSCSYGVYFYFSDIKLFGATPHTNFRGQSETSESAIQSIANPIAGLAGDVLPAPVRKIVKKAINAGFSKPTIPSVTSRNTIQPYGNMVLVDGHDPTIKLSTCMDHELGITQLGVDNLDEMAIKNIVTKPEYFGKFDWSTMTELGTQICALPVSPNSINYFTNATIPQTAPTHFRYIANCFRFWRGTIRYVFHIVGTKYHSGRLRFVYSLGGKLPNKIGDDVIYAFSYIVDIRDSAKIVIDCPFFSSTAWRTVPQVFSDKENCYVDGIVGQYDDEMSWLQVYCENTLRCTPTVSSTINLIVMQCAGEDIEFAAPMAPRSIPTTAYNNSAMMLVSKKRLVKSEFIRRTDNDTPLDGVKPKTEAAYQTLVIREVDGANSVTNEGEVELYEREQKVLKQAEEIRALYKKMEEANKAKKEKEKDNLAKEIRAYGDDRAIATILSYKKQFQAKPQVETTETIITPINMITSSHNVEKPMIGTISPLTVGENVSNIRSLIRRQFLIGTATITGQLDVVSAPYCLTTPIATDKVGHYYYDFFSYFAHMYRFYRGGIRLTIACTNQNVSILARFEPFVNDFILSKILADKPFGDYAPIWKYNLDGKSFSTIPAATNQPFATVIQGGAQVEVPYYAKVHKTVVRFTNHDNFKEAFQSIYYSRAPTGALFIHFLNDASDTKARASIYRGVADDFNFGYIVGAPLTAVNAFEFPNIGK